jgi:hypothetical protein
MKKGGLPSPKSWPDLKETRTLERILCSQKGRNSASRIPWDLKIIPDTSAKYAVEEKMSPVHHHMCRTKHTIIVISHLPMPSENHAFGVNSIMQNKSSKKLVL